MTAEVERLRRVQAAGVEAMARSLYAASPLDNWEEGWTMEHCREVAARMDRARRRAERRERGRS